MFPRASGIAAIAAVFVVSALPAFAASGEPIHLPVKLYGYQDDPVFFILPPDDMADCVAPGDNAKSVARCSAQLADPSMKSRAAQILYTRGRIFLQDGRPDKALPDFKEAVRLRPDYSAAYNAAGAAEAKTPDSLAALPDFNDAIHADPKNARAYSNRGGWLARTFGNTFASNGMAPLVDLNKAIELDPTLPPAFQNRAYMRQRMADSDLASWLVSPSDAKPSDGINGNLRRAVDDYDAALRLWPQRVPTWKPESSPVTPVIYLWRANALADLRDFDRAVADYAQAIKFDPDSPFPYAWRGYANYVAGKFKAAADDFRQAVERAASHDARLATLRIVEPWGAPSLWPLWRFLAQGRGGEDGTANLAAAHVSAEDPMYPVVQYFLGRGNRDDALNGKVVEWRTRWKDADECIRIFFVTEYRLLKLKGGKDKEVEASLPTVAATCASGVTYGPDFKNLETVLRQELH